MTKNLQELFAQKIFRIPDYQRGYAWESKQLEDLWEDLLDIQTKEDGEFVSHYTGTIYLKKIVPCNPTEDWYKNNASFYEVVDGQQRLTTIVILLFELLKVSEKGYSYRPKSEWMKIYICDDNEDLKIYRFAYETTNREFLFRNIFEDSTVSLPNQVDNVYTKNLLYAKSFFRERIRALSDEEREVLFLKLQKAVQFDERLIDDGLDVQAVFETLNNRGKQLTTLEKLKNRLLYLCDKMIAEAYKPQLSKQINDCWGKVYLELGRNQEFTLDEDEFLSAYLTLIRNGKESSFSNQAASDKVFKMFCAHPERYNRDYSTEEMAVKEDAISYRKINDFCVGMADFAPFWYKAMCTDQDIIRQIGYLDFRKEIRIFVAVLLQKKAFDTSVNTDLSLLLTEHILFRNSVPGLWIVDGRSFAGMAKDLYTNEESVDELNDKLSEYAHRPVNKENMVRAFQQLYFYERGAKGFHRWGGLKYLLYKYEMYLQKNEPCARLQWSQYPEVTIEHVLPQSYETYWGAIRNEYIESLEITETEHVLADKILINTLGNLTLLKGSKNSKLQNDSWEEKKMAYEMGSFNEYEICKNELWDKHSISNRGHKILSILQQWVPELQLTKEEIDLMLFCDKKFFVKD